MTETADVLVVGAGPAGTVAAAELARHGRHTLLVGEPRTGPGHDVVLSAPARHALGSLPGWHDAFVRPVDALDLWFGARTRRVITDAGQGVCDLSVLTDALGRTAAEAGAELLCGRVAVLHRTESGHQAVLTDGTRISARHVVLASGPDATRSERLMCAQRLTGVDHRDRISLHLITPAADDPHTQPSCAWVLPGTDGSCTLTVTGCDQDPVTLMSDALAALAGTDPRFRGAQPTGPLTTGPVDSGFAPENAVREDGLLVGDAAGLVNPFTGEGLSYAVESGLLAAESIAEHGDDPRRPPERTRGGSPPRSWGTSRRPGTQRAATTWPGGCSPPPPRATTRSSPRAAGPCCSRRASPASPPRTPSTSHPANR